MRGFYAFKENVRRRQSNERQRDEEQVARVIRIGLIGNIKNDLDDDQLEAIGVVDVLILPVGGGGYTLDATSASSIVRQVEPKVVIPIHYAEPGVHYEVPQDTLDTFTKELGAPVEPVDKFKVKSVASLPLTLTVMPLKRV